MNFTFERLSDSNIYHLRLLHHACYKKWLPEGYFEAKYNTKYLTPARFGHLAFHNNLCVAFNGMIPCAMEYNGQVELSAQSSDSMTHPAYMKRGLFTAVIERNYTNLRNEHIGFLWGFPNSYSSVIFPKKLGWKSTEAMNGYRIHVVNRYAAYFKRIANTAYYGDNALQKIFENQLVTIAPSNSLAGSGFVTAVRNSDFFRYKQFGGSILIKLEGITLWIKQNGALFIGDMDSISPSQLKQLMPLLTGMAKRCGASEIYFQSHSGSQVEAAFAAQYPMFVSWQILYDNLSSKFPLDKIRVTMGELDSF
ncbi:MAG TPA: GNAT family N-acetyltransferase [Chitinophagales bacterium]|nr:GNAT family N-acetyltransferase [Chitinophagales bacterium]